MKSLVHPALEFGPLSKRPEELLLLCHYDPNGISTVSETVGYLQRGSLYSVTVLNLFEHSCSTQELSLSPYVNLARFSAVLVHNTVAYNIDNLRSLDKHLRLKLKDFDGPKLLFKQDENFRFREVDEYIDSIGFDVVFTCLPPEALPKIYSKSISTSRFVRMLTGYVTPALRLMNPPIEGRPIDIGYRGSIQPLSFGRLAYEKRKIGEDIQNLLGTRGLNLDISSRWEDRKGGADWFDFLASCKATLGAESGASVFDINGDLQQRCQNAERVLGPFREDHFYAESYLSHLRDLEGIVSYNQISPRHFEAVAARTLQLLYAGSYSEILQAGRHYFPLNRDYSNLDEAIDLLNNDVARAEMVDRAYNEVILKQDYWIETFVKSVDDEIALALDKRNKAIKPIFSLATEAINVLLLSSHEPKLDPRLEWIAKYAPSPVKIHQCGVLHKSDKRIIREVVDTTQTLYQAIPRRKYERGMWQEWRRLTTDLAGLMAVNEVIFLEQVLRLSDKELAEIFSAPLQGDRLVEFRWQLGYILDITASLVTDCLKMRGVHAIIAADLDTLLPAIVLKSIFKVPVIYDAHEYWPEANTNSQEFEQRYWISLENKLVSSVDYRQVVSPGLAKLMSAQYQCDFSVLPNVEPYSNKEASLKSTQKSTLSKCKFLFHGGFAIGRELEHLIQIWPKTDKRAVLILRGRDNEYKAKLVELARSTGLLNKRIFFPDAVDESELITSAAEADVGLVPYPPVGNNYKHCSPNKLSQYMAAGLPVLANDTSFVREVLSAAECGVVIDFKQEEKLISVINDLTANEKWRLKLASSGCEYRRSTFNWQRMSNKFYDTLCALVPISPEIFSIYELEQNHYYFPRNSSGFDAVMRYINIALLGDDPHSNHAEAIKRYLRPLWRRLPQSVRTRVHSVIYRK